MKIYVWVTFAFMGWAYYEVSGGSDFVPQQVIAQNDAVEPVAEGDAPDIVARAETTTLMSLSTSNVAPQPTQSDEDVTQALMDAMTLDGTETPAAEIVAVSAPVIEDVTPPIVDLRNVAGSRVNMRMGPSTDYEVITTLSGGTEIEVLQVNADGWANVMIVESGIEGWMAERLLSDPQG